MLLCALYLSDKLQFEITVLKSGYTAECQLYADTYSRYLSMLKTKRTGQKQPIAALVLWRHLAVLTAQFSNITLEISQKWTFKV